MSAIWPKKPTRWFDGRTMFVSVPFTWNLPSLRDEILAGSLLWDHVVLGGPAIKLMPHYLANLPMVTLRDSHPGVLQRVNPRATKTTLGCPRRCGFCGVKTIEPKYVELEDWPDLPEITDSNLLAASEHHFDRVMDRLERWTGADFNQGLDARLLNEHHVERLARLKRPFIRMAIDSMAVAEIWADAIQRLHAAGCRKADLRCLAVVGFNDTPDEAWERLRFVKANGVSPSPTWFHPLDALEMNTVTDRQKALGWTDDERKRFMQWWYWRRDRGKPKVMASFNDAVLDFCRPPEAAGRVG